jgi:ATP-dependent DNA ligase
MGVGAPLRLEMQTKRGRALATAIGAVSRGERWIHEIKFDGYRGYRFTSLMEQ